MQELCNVFLQLDEIRVKPANTVRQLFSGHGILVEHPPKGFFVQVDLLDLLGTAASTESLRSSFPSVFCNSPSSSGEIVRRSHPASSVISPGLRKLAPITSVR